MLWLDAPQKRISCGVEGSIGPRLDPEINSILMLMSDLGLDIILELKYVIQ